jgi:hypothetical protein
MQAQAAAPHSRQMLQQGRQSAALQQQECMRHAQRSPRSARPRRSSAACRRKADEAEFNERLTQLRQEARAKAPQVRAAAAGASWPCWWHGTACRPPLLQSQAFPTPAGGLLTARVGTNAGTRHQACGPAFRAGRSL